MAKVIARRMTAEIEGYFVVFLIGMRINKFWKVWKWLPTFRVMGRMLNELKQDPGSGFLGANIFIGGPRLPMTVQYWRSFEHLVAYARNEDRAHWPALMAYNDRVGSSGDVGIWHETYLVSPGKHEGIYSNMPPIGLGEVGELVPAEGPRETAASRLRMRSEAYPEGAPTERSNS